MKTCTLGFIIFCCTLVSIQANGQDLDQKGIKILTNESLSDVQQSQLLAFDFEQYRKAAQSVFIKVINGPTIELLAKKPTSAKAPVKAVAKVDSEHLTPNERPLPKVEIIQVNVFNTAVK